MLTSFVSLLKFLYFINNLLITHFTVIRVWSQDYYHIIKN